MRILNKNEQDLCKRILAGNGNNNYLGNIINNKLWGVCISGNRVTLSLPSRTSATRSRIFSLKFKVDYLNKRGDFMSPQKSSQTMHKCIFGCKDNITF